jgi:hypothetical protein
MRKITWSSLSVWDATTETKPWFPTYLAHIDGIAGLT